MSYILDALKKAERERGLAEVPTLETMHGHSARIRVHLWMIPGLFVLGSLVALWFILPSLRSGSTPSSSIPDGTVPTPNPSAFIRSQKVPPVAVTPQGPQSNALVEDPPNLNAHVPEMEPRNSLSRVQRFNQSNSPSIIPEGTPKPQELPPQEAIERILPGPSDEPSVQISSESAAARPLSLADAIAGMTMSIHMFSDDKAERMVFINGRKYLEGDYVDKVYLLESITPEGAVLRYGTTRAILRPGSR